MHTPIYAIGDIHGQIDELDRVLNQIRADGGPDAEIVFLGDYVDRGPDSRAVIDRLRAGVDAGRPWHVLRGNHDRMFCRFMRDGTVHDDRILSGKGWFHRIMGGIETMASYGVDASERRDARAIQAEAIAAVPPDHVDFLQDRPLYLERGGLLFVHAGILPGVPLGDQTEDDLIWIRRGFLDHPDPHPWLVVHGHTALDAPFHFGNRIDLDGGAGYGRPLSAAVFEGTDCWLLAGNTRLRLEP
ncbi:MAG: metallophosphoesterase family protein [Marinibacterium sp.]